MALQLAYRGADATTLKALGSGERSIDRIVAIVHGLLAFARAGAQPEPGARAPVDAAVHDVGEDLANEAARAGIDLRVESGCGCNVACASGVLISVLQNLARNSIKHMGRQTVRRVSVRAEDRGTTVRFEVIDTGPGIRPSCARRSSSRSCGSIRASPVSGWGWRR